MNLLDSSAWLEFFIAGKNADIFEEPLEKLSEVVVPTIVIFEVFKKIMQDRDKEIALRYVAKMKKGRVVDLDADLSLSAALFSRNYKLAMADSIIWATAQLYNATIWTQDADFKNLSGVKYFPKNTIHDIK